MVVCMHAFVWLPCRKRNNQGSGSRSGPGYGPEPQNGASESRMLPKLAKRGTYVLEVRSNPPLPCVRAGG